MNINFDELKQALINLLNAVMEAEVDGGKINIDSAGNIVNEEAAALDGKKPWLHTIFEVYCTDDEFHLIVNPRLKFKQEIDLMDEDIPDTVAEAVDFLWDDICCGVNEYQECFNPPADK